MESNKDDGREQGGWMTQKALQAINFFTLLQDDILIIGCTEQRVPSQPSPVKVLSLLIYPALSSPRTATTIEG